MGKKTRIIIPNVQLNPRIFGCRKDDFFKFIFPPALIFLTINMFLIIGFMIYNLPLICLSVFTVGFLLVLFYEVEYCYRVCDIIGQYIKYYKKGDVLYENFEREE